MARVEHLGIARRGYAALLRDLRDGGPITETREYVFVEWGERRSRNGPVNRFRGERAARGRPGGVAERDLESLRARLDTNGDGKLAAANAEFAQFKVMVTNADGSTTAMTLAQLGIAAINLTVATTQIALWDGVAFKE